MMKFLKNFENNRLDNLLDKISDSGINSLSKHEKDFLDKFSKGQDTKNIESQLDSKVINSQTNLYEVVCNRI